MTTAPYLITSGLIVAFLARAMTTSRNKGITASIFVKFLVLIVFGYIGYAGFSIAYEALQSHTIGPICRVCHGATRVDDGSLVYWLSLLMAYMAGTVCSAFSIFVCFVPKSENA